jgi:hypothetical protein
MASAHTRLQAHADPIRALSETCALLGREGWTFTTDTTEGNDGAFLVRAHALVRCQPHDDFARAAALDTFVVLTAQATFDPVASYKGAILSGYTIAFQPGELREGPIKMQDLAGYTEVDFHSVWTPSKGVRSPAAFAHALATVVLPVEE